MKLSYDWLGFQSVFSPTRRTSLVADPVFRHPVYFILDQGFVITGYAENEDLGDWVGCSKEDVSEHFQHREIYFFDRKTLDQHLDECVDLNHILDQRESLKTKALQTLDRGGLASKKGKKELSRDLMRNHFLMEALTGWWSRFLPSSYVIFIRLESQNPTDFVVLFRRGKIELFQKPLFSTLGSERVKNPKEMVKALSDKYAVPVQGIFVPESVWIAWSASSDPWKRVAQSIRKSQVRLFPFRWSFVSLIGLRAYLGF